MKFIKMRVISMVKFSLAPTMDNSKVLPSTPSTIHSLVNVLTNSLFQLHDENMKGSNIGYNAEDTRRSFQTENNHVRDSILDLLDQLAKGELITLNKKFYGRYLVTVDGSQFTDLDSRQAAQYCVLEGVCKSFLNRRVLQENKGASSRMMGIPEISERYSRIPERKCDLLLTLLEVKDGIAIENCYIIGTDQSHTLQRYWLPQSDTNHPGFKLIARLYCSLCKFLLVLISINCQF
jgi:hypothetical protein